MPAPEYDRNVFINGPFDDAYAPIFEAVVFAVHDAGFRPKCAREKLDSSQIRVQKIANLISVSRYSIHDLSRTQLDDANQLPRFNMPFELGMDVGCKVYSGRDDTGAAQYLGRVAKHLSASGCKPISLRTSFSAFQAVLERALVRVDETARDAVSDRGGEFR